MKLPRRRFLHMAVGAAALHAFLAPRVHRPIRPNRSAGSSAFRQAAAPFLDALIVIRSAHHPKRHFLDWKEGAPAVAENGRGSEVFP